MENKINKFLILINDLKDINTYKKMGINNFAVYLKDFSIGYEKTYTLKDIINFDNVFIVMNKILSTKEIEEAKKILENIPSNVAGVIISDLGLYNFLKNKKVNVILNLRHFGTNSSSINYFLKMGFKSYILANEITYKEIEKISSNCIKPIILEIFSHNLVSYSRRYLITNYNNYYKENLAENIIIKDKISNESFKVIEEKENGTIFLSDKIYNGLKLLDIDNVLFYFINTSFIDTKYIVNMLKDLKENKITKIPNSNEGFLFRDTIYKVKRGE